MQQNSGSFNYELPYSSESIFNHNHLTTITEDPFKYTTIYGFITFFYKDCGSISAVLVYIIDTLSRMNFALSINVCGVS